MVFKFLVLVNILVVARAGDLIGYGAPAYNSYASYAAPTRLTTYSAAPSLSSLSYSTPAVHSYASPAIAQYAAPALSYSTPVLGSYAAPITKFATAPIATYAAHAPVIAKTIIEEKPVAYDFEYGVNDPHTGDIKHQQESRRGDQVQGSYSLVEPDGTKRTVEYTAGDHSGFNAIVHREPLHHPVAPVVTKVAAPVATYAPSPAINYAPAVAKVVSPISAYSTIPSLGYGYAPKFASPLNSYSFAPSIGYHAGPSISYTSPSISKLAGYPTTPFYSADVSHYH